MRRKDKIFGDVLSFSYFLIDCWHTCYKISKFKYFLSVLNAHCFRNISTFWNCSFLGNEITIESNVRKFSPLLL